MILLIVVNFVFVGVQVVGSAVRIHHFSHLLFAVKPMISIPLHPLSIIVQTNRRHTVPRLVGVFQS